MTNKYLFNLDSRKHIQDGIQLADKNFITRLASNFRLVIYLNSDQFVMAVSDILSRKLLCLRSYTFFNILSQDDWVNAVKSLVNSEADLRLPYGKVFIEYLTTNMTMVPSKLFMEDKAEEFYRFNVSDGEGNTINTTLLESADAHVIYSIHGEVKAFLEKTYPSAKMLNAVAPLVNSLLAKEHAQPTLCVYVQPSLMVVILVDKKQLKYCNIFSYKTPEDFIYFLLYANHQMGLDNEKVPLVLIGEIIEDSAIYRQVFKYIRNVSFGKRTDWLKVAGDMQFPSQFYFNLFCEL